MPLTWKIETNRYIGRLQALPVRISEASSILSSLNMTLPRNFGGGVRTNLMVQLVLFNIGSLRAAHDLTKAAELLFCKGIIASVCLQLRLLYEFWGATALASALCDRVRDAANFEDAASLREVVIPVRRLVGGSRFAVKLPWGGETNTKSFNIMNFIQHLEKYEPGTQNDYDFLCEACHPSYFQQTYFWMAGSAGDNWNNDVFREHAHTILEQLILAGERATLGLIKATEHVTAVSKPFVVTAE